MNANGIDVISNVTPFYVESDSVEKSRKVGRNDDLANYLNRNSTHLLQTISQLTAWDQNRNECFTIHCYFRGRFDSHATFSALYLPQTCMRRIQKLNFPSIHWSNDGFGSTISSINNSCSKSIQKRDLKYKLLYDIISYRHYNFLLAESECKRPNYLVWEIIDGQPERDVVAKNIKYVVNSNVCLNVEVIRNHQDVGDKGELSDVICKHNDLLLVDWLNVE